MAASDFLDIKPIEPFNFREDTCKLDPLWEKWKKCLSYYMLATATDNDPQKRDISQHLLGREEQSRFWRGFVIFGLVFSA